MLSEKYKCDQSGKNKFFLWLSLDNGHFITDGVEYILEFIYNKFNKRRDVIMIIDTDKTVSMTEANQNFSKIARMAMEYGDVTILKNNRVFLTVHYAAQDKSVNAAPDEDVLASSEKLMKRNKHVYEELAK